ncbi:MAG TPA: hypothetical protein VLJ57_24370 [Burkholderiaceae bacterium]|nr:hypothetical protein [Burkholderiaceae bacterium]
MRTYDKLIATISASQGSGGLRSSFGTDLAAGLRVAPMARPSSQDMA